MPSATYKDFPPGSTLMSLRLDKNGEFEWIDGEGNPIGTNERFTEPLTVRLPPSVFAEFFALAYLQNISPATLAQQLIWRYCRPGASPGSITPPTPRRIDELLALRAKE